MVGLRRAVPLTAQAYVGPSKRRDGWVRRYQPSSNADTRRPAWSAAQSRRRTELVYVAWRSSGGHPTIRIVVASAILFETIRVALRRLMQAFDRCLPLKPTRIRQVARPAPVGKHLARSFEVALCTFESALTAVSVFDPSIPSANVPLRS